MVEVAAEALAVLFLLGCLVLLARGLRGRRDRRPVVVDGSHSGLLFGLLLFAAFAMGVFLTYALLIR